MSQEMTQEKVEQVTWDTLVDSLSMNPDFDRDGAVRFADQVKELVHEGRLSKRDELRAAMWGRIRHTASVVAAISLTIAVVGGGIGTGVWYMFHVHANDYAHTDPASVRDGAFFYIHSWYGENDLPAALVEQTQTHGQVDGHNAWLTRWVSRDGKKVCAYVWGKGATTGSPHGTFGKVVACP